MFNIAKNFTFVKYMQVEVARVHRLQPKHLEVYEEGLYPAADVLYMNIMMMMNLKWAHVARKIYNRCERKVL